MFEARIEQLFAELTGKLNTIEQTTASTLSSSSQVVTADVKELITIYPKAKPFIQDTLLLLQALPFSWAKMLANVITLLMRIVDDITTNTPTGTTA